MGLNKALWGRKIEEEIERIHRDENEDVERNKSKESGSKVAHSTDFQE